MTDPAGDDQIIATAFRRSIYVFVGIVALIVAAILIQRLLQPELEEQADAVLVAPQELDRKAQVTPPTVIFRDITSSAGITHSHENGAVGDRLLPETMGGGVAFFDYNGDSAVDLLFVSGTSWETDGDSMNSLYLYENDGSGNFVDVTEAAALRTSLYGMAPAVGDYDGDGDLDLFVSTLGTNHLFRNIDGRRFEEVGNTAGVAGHDDSWSTGAAFVDYDNDDDLDLVVLNYVQWSRDIDFAVDYRLTGIGRAYGPPTQYAGTYSYVYQNNGDGTFTDVSASIGIQVDNPATGLPLGKGLAVLPVDVDGDGWTDLVVANDTVQNFLFKNEAGTRFEEIGVSAGVAFDNTGVATGAMGLDDAMLSPQMERAIAIGNFANEMTSFYVQPSAGQIFTDQAIVMGIGPASRQSLTFGLFFFDYDLDGGLDLMQANGHVENDIAVVQPSQRYAQEAQLFWNCGLECPRQFTPVSYDPEKNDIGSPVVGRGASYADIDRDGDLDIVLTQIGAAPLLLRNEQTTEHNWIQFDVLNEVGSADYGAVVELVSQGQRQHRRVEPTRSYLSQVETTLSFGLGTSTSVEQANIRWSDGRSLRLDDPAVNQRHRISPDRLNRVP